MKISERTKRIFFYGLFPLFTNLILQRNWEPVILGASIFIIGGLIFPKVITFMTDKERDNRYS